MGSKAVISFGEEPDAGSSDEVRFPWLGAEEQLSNNKVASGMAIERECSMIGWCLEK